MFKTKKFDSSRSVLKLVDLEVRHANDVASTPIIERLSMEIREGETVCLVGESGSGKSVTSLAVMGLLPTNALTIGKGKILLEGEDLLDLSPAQMRRARSQRVSMIFQEPMTALNPVIKVGEQIEEVLQFHTDLKKAVRRARALEIMKEVHLPDIERVYESYPHQLSGGQRQRIMIAMALIMNPKLLIADEPTTALDVTTQTQILKLIRELQEKYDTAVLFITHDMGVVADIADTVYVMQKGKILEAAPAEVLFRRPEHEYTRKLLKAVPSLHPRTPREARSAEIGLRVQSVEKIYPGGTTFGKKAQGFAAAKDITFDILRGRTVGIVGESGSGKTTVARCIMRLIDPTAGEIFVGSSDIANLRRRELQPYRNQIQIVFQDPYRSLNPRWTVGKSITEGPINFGVKRQDAYQQARELLELVGLPGDAFNRYPHQFSGGQRQRIAIARAVAMRPQVLVADEAVSALDVSVQAQVLELLDGLQEKLGIAILFITHDLRVAAQICDDVIVMHRGKVVEYDTAENVLLYPKHPYTKSLIEAAPGRGWDFANFKELAALN